MKKGLVIIGSNQYGVVSEFISGIRQDLQSLNITTELLDLNSPSSIEYQASREDRFDEFDFFISFNAVGLDLSFNGMMLTEVMKRKPVFVFLVDHPLHLITRFIGLNVILLCVDQEHVGFAQLCGIRAHFFPHAVPADMVAGPTEFSGMAQKHGILFPASYFDTAQWRQKLQPVWHQVGHFLENCQSVTRFMQHLQVLPSGNKPATVGLDHNIQLLSIYADFYIRGRQREKILQLCQDSGLAITVVGNGSQQYKNRFPLHQYLDAVPFKTLLSLIQNARFVLHNSPGFELGLHERIVYPMALGTPVVCDLLARPDRILGADYQLLTINNIAGMNAAQYLQIQHENRAMIRQRHTWRYQLQSLMREYHLLAETSAQAVASC